MYCLLLDCVSVFVGGWVKVWVVGRKVGNWVTKVTEKLAPPSLGYRLNRVVAHAHTNT